MTVGTIYRIGPNPEPRVALVLRDGDGVPVALRLRHASAWARTLERIPKRLEHLPVRGERA